MPQHSHCNTENVPPHAGVHDMGNLGATARSADGDCLTVRLALSQQGHYQTACMHGACSFAISSVEQALCWCSLGLWRPALHQRDRTQVQVAAWQELSRGGEVAGPELLAQHD